MSARPLVPAAPAASGPHGPGEAFVFEDPQSRPHTAGGPSAAKAPAPPSETTAPATLQEAARALMNV